MIKLRVFVSIGESGSQGVTQPESQGVNESECQENSRNTLDYIRLLLYSMNYSEWTENSFDWPFQSL